VEYLLGSTARLGDIIVLGLLTQLKEVHLSIISSCLVRNLPCCSWNCHFSTKVLYLFNCLSLCGLSLCRTDGKSLVL